MLNPEPRIGSSLVHAFPDCDGKVVQSVMFRDILVITLEFAVYTYDGETLERLVLAPSGSNNNTACTGIENRRE